MKAQMKIMQMAFMIIAIFIFFALVGLFFLRIQLGDVESNAAQLQKEQAISSLKVIADMPELACGGSESLCLDEDKLRVMSGNFSSVYDLLWPVASVKVYRVYPAFSEILECPSLGCNYYEIYDSGQTNVKEYSTYVSICKKIEEVGYVYDRCEVGKLVVGAKVYGE